MSDEITLPAGVTPGPMCECGQERLYLVNGKLLVTKCNLCERRETELVGQSHMRSVVAHLKAVEDEKQSRKNERRNKQPQPIGRVIHEGREFFKGGPSGKELAVKD